MIISMLFPKKVKFRKWQKMRSNPKKVRSTTRGATVSFGDFAIKATSSSRIKSNQIEAARRVISRSSGKSSRTWIRIFPDRPFTRKPAEVKMGKGKGAPEGFEVEVLPGRVLFELSGVTEEVAKISLIKAGKKLPVGVRFVKK